jgi:hypothetical protein
MSSGYSPIEYRRRRSFLPFLTWAFFLSEAFREVTDHAGGVANADDLAAPNTDIAQADGATASPGDESGPSRAWMSSAAPDQLAAAHALIPHTDLPHASLAAPGRLSHDFASSGVTRSGGGGEHSNASATGAVTVQDAGMLQDGSHPYPDPGLHADAGAQIGLENGSISLVVHTSDVGGLIGTISDVLLSDYGLIGGAQGALGLVEPVLSLDALPKLTDALSGLDLLKGSVVPSPLLDVQMPGEPAGDLVSATHYSEYHIALQVGPSGFTETSELSATTDDWNGVTPMAFGDDVFDQPAQHAMQHSILPLPVLDEGLRGSIDLIS